MKICLSNLIFGQEIAISLKNQPNSRDFVKFLRVSFHQNCLPDQKWIYLKIQSSDNPSEPFFPRERLKKADYLSKLGAKMGKNSPKFEIDGS